MPVNWHRKLLDRLLLIFCYCSIFIGTLSSVVDYRRQCIISKPCFTICAYISNFIVLASTPLLAQFATIWETNFEQNLIILNCNRCMIITMILLNVYIIAFRRQRERRFLKLTAWTFELDTRYVRSWLPTSRATNRRLDIIHLTKLGTMLMQSLFIFTSSLYFAQELDWQRVIQIIYLTTVLNVIHSTFFQYFTVLMHLLYRFENLNLQLESLYYSLSRRQALCLLRLRDGVNPMLQLSLFTVSDLQSLAQEHYHVTALTRHLSTYLKFVTLCVLLWNLLQSIVYGVYIFFALDSKENRESRNWFAIAVITMLYAMLYLDLYLFYWSCEAITSAYCRTTQLLQLFNNLKLSKALTQQLETFSLQLTTKPLYIGASGVYTLGHASFLALCVYIQRTILILIQFEFERRLKLLRQHLNVELTEEIEDFIMDYKM
ncbi:hypothetical protein ACLKA7_014301 [Drosophila subpalustris]